MRRTLPLTVSTLLAAMTAVLLPATAARAQNDAISVRLDQFGAGQSYRPGDFASLRLELTSTLAEPVQLWVQVEIANPDGDIGEYGRTISLAGGGTASTWIHVPLPADFDPRAVLPVRIFEERDGRRGAELGGGRINPGDSSATLVEPLKSMIAVVGQGSTRLALDDYMNPSATGGRPPFGHEDTRVVPGIRPVDLPDRWEGLKQFEAIAWSAFSPRELGDDQVEAIRAYVQRGGHLVIVLPDTGNPWGLGAEGLTRFEDLLPTAAPRRDLGVPLERLLPVLTKVTRPPATIPQTVHVFRDGAAGLDAIDNAYVPLVALDDGRVVVIQRTFGFGRITICGINVADRQLLSVPNAVQADIWWNRILGRRSDTPTGQELVAIRAAQRLVTSAVPENSLGGGLLVEQSISLSEQAGYGLLTSFVVIVLYWLAAGPGGFWLLKQHRLQRHAWLAFAASAVVFTAAAWGIVTVIKPGGHRVRHLTFLDMIARPDGDRGAVDPQYQRAIAWFSVNLPGYRRASIMIDSTPGQRDLLSSWSAPEAPLRPFPNPDRYRVDVGGPPASERHFERDLDGDREFRRPSRATATQLAAHWLGGLDAEWGGTIRSHPDDPVRLVVDPDGTERLEGSIIHDLPGELDQVSIIWVRNKRTSGRRYARSDDVVHPWVPTAFSGQMLNLGGMWRRSTWSADEAIGLGEITRSTGRGLEAEIRQRYVDEYARSGYTAIASPGGPIREPHRTNYLEMLGLFSQLEPPKYLLDQVGRQDAQTVAFYRLVGRELDLGPWFAGPCLIVTGRLAGVPTPIPLRVDGEAPRTEEDSLVIVRWLLPLPMRDDLAFTAAAPTGDALAAADRPRP